MARYFRGAGVQAFYAFDEGSDRKVAKREIHTYNGSYYSLVRTLEIGEMPTLVGYSHGRVVGATIIESPIDLLAHQRNVRSRQNVTAKAFAVRLDALEFFLNPRNSSR